MSKLVRSLMLKGKTLLTEKEQQTRCEKCEKRPATGQDGLCDHCRFNDVLTRMAETK